jgi:hypothetical protein
MNRNLNKIKMESKNKKADVKYNSKRKKSLLAFIPSVKRTSYEKWKLYA